MIIKNVQATHDRKATILSAKCKIRRFGWDAVYFKISARQRAYICDDASPFAAALLIPSMKLGEDLIIHGAISKQLYSGMQAIMQEVLGWNIGLKPIEIKADKLTEDKYHPTKTATFFSGGVDSFYTYLKHKQDKIKSHRVDSFIFVNNSFDIDPRNTKLWELTLKNIRAIAKSENIELVVVESNVNSHELLTPIVPWDYIHGGCLAATGLFLRSAFRRVYIPSTHSAAQQIHWGTNLALDNNWSTERLAFIHDGTEATRLNKVVWQIAKSPVALKHLRVCYQNTNGAYNCGRCDKCLRTMINLYIAGVLQKAGTFPRHIDPNLVASTPTINDEHGGPIFHTENLAALKEGSLNPALQKAIAASLKLTGTTRTGRMQKLKDKIAYFDHRYTDGIVLSVTSGLFGKRFV